MADTIVELLDLWAEARGDAPALIYRGETISYAALAERSRRVAAGLARIGIGAGDRVALWMPNVPAYLDLCFGLARLGAVAVAVNTRFRHMEVEDIVGRSRSCALVLWPGFKDIDFAGLLDRMDAQRLAALHTVIAYGEDGASLPTEILGRRVLPFVELARSEPMAVGPAVGPDTPSNIFTTSGTTRAPKFVLHTHRSLARHAQDVAPAFGWDAPDAVTVQPLPLCGVFGFVKTLCALTGGGRVIVHPLFDAEKAAADVIAWRATHLTATDDMIWRMLAVRPEPQPFPSIRLCGYGIFNPALTDFAEETRRRGLNLVGMYGMSEVQALFSKQRAEDPPERRLPGGGYPVSPAAEVRVCDPDTGAVLAPGVSGELQFRAPSMMAGYADDPAATAAAFTADGWFRSGDAGHVRGDGSFVFEARMGDVLRLAGFLTSPAEIEAHIATHPDVAGVQVVGVTTRRGLQPFAFVIPRDGARGVDEGALRRFCVDAMANYKVPVGFAALEAFPVTESPNAIKIQRHRLREMAEAIIADREAGAA